MRILPSHPPPIESDKFENKKQQAFVAVHYWHKEQPLKWRHVAVRFLVLNPHKQQKGLPTEESKGCERGEYLWLQKLMGWQNPNASTSSFLRCLLESVPSGCYPRIISWLLF